MRQACEVGDSHQCVVFREGPSPWSEGLGLVCLRASSIKKGIKLLPVVPQVTSWFVDEITSLCLEPMWQFQKSHDEDLGGGIPAYSNRLSLFTPSHWRRWAVWSMSWESLWLLRHVLL